jgi:hypothetical protein
MSEPGDRAVSHREHWSTRKPAELSPEDHARAHIAGYEPGPEDHYVGRDPRQMSPGELTAMGHKRHSPIDAIRAKCLDCCGGSTNEVRRCVAVICPNWPFRTGQNPWRAPPSQAQREASRRNAARMHAERADAVRVTGPDAGS